MVLFDQTNTIQSSLDTLSKGEFSAIKMLYDKRVMFSGAFKSYNEVDDSLRSLLAFLHSRYKATKISIPFLSSTIVYPEPEMVPHWYFIDSIMTDEQKKEAFSYYNRKPYIRFHEKRRKK